MKKNIFPLFVFFISTLSACKSNPKSDIDSLKSDNGISMDSSHFFRPLSDEEINFYHDKADSLFHKMYGDKFNGQFLVAKNGQIVFEKYQGIYDFKNQDSISPSNPMHLASISKTFTGMTILHLWEQGKLSLDDSLQKFFPAMPYHGVTIKLLLEHRSGLPNYLNFMDAKLWNMRQKATNQDVINVMIEKHPPIMAYPDRTFHYCNTNFMLLASIIEKVTHKSYPDYMRDSVFHPLGMEHTFVFQPKDTANYVVTYLGRRPYPLDPLDCTYGDKNIYSTVRDLLHWDIALYLNRFIKGSTLQMALSPSSNERSSMHNYGMAWRMYFAKNGDSIIYHNGHWHGSNTVFTRLLKDTATIIALGNTGDKRIYAAKAFSSIFTGKQDYPAMRAATPKTAVKNVEKKGEIDKVSHANKHYPNGRKSR